MKKFLSRYHPRYIRSLVYMLQASEYHMLDFLAWEFRAENFMRIEHRKHVRWTPKAVLLYACGWLLVALWLSIVARAFLAAQAGSDVPLVAGVLLLLFFPLALPLLLLMPLALLHVLQWPAEQWMFARVARVLATHKGIKIAVAGSYGKTSMREILRTALSERLKVAAPGGSENTPLAIARFVKRLAGDEKVLIFEFGEYYPGDIKKLSEMVRPDMGIITGVNEAHLSKFGTIEAARDTIYELVDFLGDRPLYCNSESRYTGRSAPHSIWYSRERAGEWIVVAPETSLDGTSFILEKGSERIAVQSKLLGLHAIGPLAVAAVIAKELGLTNEEVQRGLAKTKAFAHRLERKEDASGVITLDDSYNGNPDGVQAVIAFLANIEGHRRWYVTPGLVELGERSEAIHRDMGRQLAEAGIEKVALIRNSVTPWIEAGLKAHKFEGDVEWFGDALKCYESLPHITVSGDVVLLQNDWSDQYA